MVKKTKTVKHKKAKKTVAKGSELSCNECGLRVAVVEDCDCARPCDLTCCGEQMVLIA